MDSKHGGCSGRCGCGTFDEGSGKSGDGGVADESGEEFEDVRENLRSVGFGKNLKGDRSFLCFIQLWIY